MSPLRMLERALSSLPLWRQRQEAHDRLQLALLGVHSEVQRTQGAALARLRVEASRFALEPWYTAAMSEYRKRSPGVPYGSPQEVP